MGDPSKVGKLNSVWAKEGSIAAGSVEKRYSGQKRDLGQDLKCNKVLKKVSGFAHRDTTSDASNDMTAFLGDDVIIRILKLIQDDKDRKVCSLLSKRWLRLEGMLRESIKVLDWGFLENGRIYERFPNLADVDLTGAWTSDAKRLVSCASFVPMYRGSCYMRLGLEAEFPFSWNHVVEEQRPNPYDFDRGLRALVKAYPGIRRLCVVDAFRLLKDEEKEENEDDDGWDDDSRHENHKLEKERVQDTKKESVYVHSQEGPQSGQKAKLPSGTRNIWRSSGASIVEQLRAKLRVNDHQEAEGLQIVARGCPMLQELEVRQCTDASLTALAECKNLQVLKLVGELTGFYHATFSDKGLIVLAKSCTRIVELSLTGGDVGYEGLTCVARSCRMLSELVIAGKAPRTGWVKSLQHCECLQTLRLEGLKHMSGELTVAAPEELGHCTSIERLQLHGCDLREKAGVLALLIVCESAKFLNFRDCWGFDDQALSLVAACRRLRKLSLDGCSLVTGHGLELVVVACKDLRALVVTHCMAIKEADVSSTLSQHMFALKELRWQPNSGSPLALAGTNIGQQGRWLVAPM
eukprot:jgi/Mesen1/7232/ME000372S06468